MVNKTVPTGQLTKGRKRIYKGVTIDPHLHFLSAVSGEQGHTAQSTGLLRLNPRWLPALFGHPNPSSVSGVKIEMHPGVNGQFQESCWKRQRKF